MCLLNTVSLRIISPRVKYRKRLVAVTRLVILSTVRPVLRCYVWVRCSSVVGTVLVRRVVNCTVVLVRDLKVVRVMVVRCVYRILLAVTVWFRGARVLMEVDVVIRVVTCLSCLFYMCGVVSVLFSLV